VFFDSVTYALAAPAAYLALTTIEGQFLTPTLVGKRLEMNSVAMFLAVVLWG
jgi:predicted PurR-regulated permease PerM